MTRLGERESYTYAVPDNWPVQVGHRVQVPFGPRSVAGYVIELLEHNPGVDNLKSLAAMDPEPLLLAHQIALAQRVAEHYWAPLIDVLRAMVPPRIRSGRSSGAGPSLRQRRHSELLRYCRPVAAATAGPELTEAQSAAVVSARQHPAVLLHGVTGGGKTEVYMAAAEPVLAEGGTVLVLVPEISLTPQLVERFSRRLGVPMAILHSHLTELERAQQWWRVRRREVKLVIGSRSAVFAPLADLGLIVVDEEGAGAYKQDRTPRYEAGWVAQELARLAGAHILLGSATPKVETYARTRSGELALAELRDRVRGRPAPIQLVDMRENAGEASRGPLSRPLVEAVTQTLEAGEQAILFLNRRGLSTFVLCRDCGAAVECPNCSVSLVHHPELGGLSCHYCGAQAPLPVLCPACGSRQIKALGLGTQRLQTMVTKLWPRARVLRLDSDIAKGPDAYWDVYQRFAQGEADVLVGTQLVARGLDLEAVTAVGVVDADQPLHFPDYRSAEAAFGLVTQVAGRAGRGQRPARVIVQTSNPDHYSLRFAQANDYRAFFEAEMPSRMMFNFPPAAALAVVTHSGADSEQIAAGARVVAESFRVALALEGADDILVAGPSPAAIHRLRGEYRWQITIRGRGLERLRHLVPRVRGWSCDVDPVA
ncbi:MAG: replication restart helicase PriA [Candidatus Dormibacteraceae bacterium]